MGGNTGEIQLGSERELYQYINHQAGTTKASTRIIFIQMYNIFRLLTGVPDYSMYVCMYGHHIQQSMDQPGKVANPARGQLNRENNIPLSPCVPENLVSRDGFSRPVPRQPAHLHTQAESGAYLRDSSRVPRRRPYETAIRHRVSPEFIGSRNCVPMALTAESPPAQGQ